MTETLAIFGFWLIGSLIGDAWMARLIVGFPSRKAVELLAIAWGLLIALCARFLIVLLGLGLLSTLVTYFVGIVASGTTARQVNSQVSGPVHDMQMNLDNVYFKKHVFAIVPRITFVIASAILFFLWSDLPRN